MHILLKRVYTGDNWERVKNSKVKPFNITDLKPKKEKVEQSDEKEYFTIQITIPNGKERVLKISKYDNVDEVADNFCKIYGLKSEIKQRLKKTINHFSNLYLKKEEIKNSYDNNSYEDDNQGADSLQYNSEENDF